MLRFVPRSFATYKKSSLDFQGNKCVLVYDEKTKVLLDSVKNHVYFYPLSFYIIYGASIDSFFGAMFSMIAFLPPIVVTTLYLSDMVTKVSLFDDGKRIELTFLLRFPRVQAKISDIKLTTPIDQQKQISNKRYHFNLGNKTYHIPGSAEIYNEDLFKEVFSGEHIELTED